MENKEKVEKTKRLRNKKLEKKNQYAGKIEEREKNQKLPTTQKIEKLNMAKTEKIEIKRKIVRKRQDEN